MSDTLSDIRQKARKILDDALPEGKVINSDGPTAATFKDMTGTSQADLERNWAAGGHMTCCNGFTGWYGQKMGSATYLGGFDLKHLAAKAGKPDSWIVSTKDNAPKYGDILRHASFHVDVSLGLDDDDKLSRAAGGQGGPIAHHDTIKRVKGLTPYDWKKLVGWIDIDLYFAD